MICLGEHDGSIPFPQIYCNCSKEREINQGSEILNLAVCCAGGTL